MKVVWTQLALADLDSAYNYMTEEKPSAAFKMIERIDQAIRAAGRHPEIGRPGRVSGTRELTVSGTPFVIPYRIKDKRVELLAVIQGARRWPDQL